MNKFLRIKYLALEIKLTREFRGFFVYVVLKGFEWLHQTLIVLLKIAKMVPIYKGFTK